MKKKILKIIAILFLILLIAGIFTFCIITYAYYSSPIVQESKINYSSYLINCLCVLLSIRPSEAACSLAMVYHENGVSHWDGYNSTALFWLKYSAFLGKVSFSQEELSGYYFFKKKDIKSAIYWMEKAAKHPREMQFSDCKNKLALLYCQEGECKNEERALALYKESAALGNKESAGIYLLLFRKLHPGEVPEEIKKK